jgi:hypothetical protein
VGRIGRAVSRAPAAKAEGGRGPLFDDSEIMDFLHSYVGKFDMYVEDDYAAFVRYCFEDPSDAAVFRSRFEPKIERLKLAG